MQSLFIIALGAAIIIAAVIADRFHVGLRAKAQIPSWIGRTWLMLCGMVLLGWGLGGTSPRFLHWSQASSSLWMWMGTTYQLVGGLLMVVVGAVLVLSKETPEDKQAKWLGALVALGGFLLFVSGVQAVL